MIKIRVGIFVDFLKSAKNKFCRQFLCRQKHNFCRQVFCRQISVDKQNKFVDKYPVYKKEIFVDKKLSTKKLFCRQSRHFVDKFWKFFYFHLLFLFNHSYGILRCLYQVLHKFSSFNFFKNWFFNNNIKNLRLLKLFLADACKQFHR